MGRGVLAAVCKWKVFMHSFHYGIIHWPQLSFVMAHRDHTHLRHDFYWGKYTSLNATNWLLIIILIASEQ